MIARPGQRLVKVIGGELDGQMMPMQAGAWLVNPILGGFERYDYERGPDGAIRAVFAHIEPRVDRCGQYWGSHGCDLPAGHLGCHRCGDNSDPCSDFQDDQVRYFQDDGTWSEWMPITGFR